MVVREMSILKWAITWTTREAPTDRAKTHLFPRKPINEIT